jgi:putative N6-adenine-specific DNA methylase
MGEEAIGPAMKGAASRSIAVGPPKPERSRDCFAIVTPGFEPVVEAELKALGAAAPVAEPGGVAFSGNDRLLFDANLWLRAATRVVVRIASFRAKSFAELERHANKVPWRDFVAPKSRVSFRVTCRKSRLYHSDAVAERLATAVTKAIAGVVTGRAAKDDEDETITTGEQLFVVRFDRDECTISADASGVLLHRRGYRLATAKAPIRETIAAGCLLALGYDGSEAFLDPMCGSGTLAIEAALIARRVAPGINRDFACERWPSFRANIAAEARKSARAAELARTSVGIAASDRDAGAVEAALANAKRAGVAADVSITRRALSSIDAAPAPGLLLTNPPYGARVGEAAPLRDLYASLGNVARGKLDGWRVALVSANRQLEGQTKLALEPVVAFSNGGIKVRLVSTRSA